MTTVGFLEARKDGVILIGARDKERDYEGPIARVSMDKTWLHITTDDYEGHAMLNIEALPHLRRALSKLAKQLRAER